MLMSFLILAAMSGTMGWTFYHGFCHLHEKMKELENQRELLLTRAVIVSNRLHRMSATLEFNYKQYENEMTEDMKDVLCALQKQVVDLIRIMNV